MSRNGIAGRRHRRSPLTRGTPSTVAARLWLAMSLVFLMVSVPGSLVAAGEKTAPSPSPKTTVEPTVEPVVEEEVVEEEVVEEVVEEEVVEEEVVEETVDEVEETVVEEQTTKAATEKADAAGSEETTSADAKLQQKQNRRGTIKIEGLLTEQPENVPHQACTLVISFRGFGTPGPAEATVTLIEPTGDPGGTITKTTVLTGTGGGGAPNFQGQIVFSEAELSALVAGTEPHTNQGFHVRVDAAVGNVTKSKVGWIFCQPQEPVPGIAVTKACPPVARVGATITYTITVSNTGEEALQDVTVVDTLLGDLSAAFPDTLAVGESVTLEFTRVATLDDPDPLANVVTASATGVESGTAVTDTDECVTNLRRPPGGVKPPPPPPPPPPPERPPLGVTPPEQPAEAGEVVVEQLPVTGLDISVWVRAVMILILSGLGIITIDSRREAEQTAVVVDSTGAYVGGPALFSALMGEESETGSRAPSREEAALGLGVVLALAGGALANRKRLA